MLEFRTDSHVAAAAETVAEQPYTPPDVRLLTSLRFRNLLSFGPDSPELDMRAHNILVGANGTGKSNFLELIHLLSMLPLDIHAPFKHSPVEQWLWRTSPEASGSKAKGQPPRVTEQGMIDTMVRRPLDATDAASDELLSYGLTLRAGDSGDPEIARETLIGRGTIQGREFERPYFVREGRETIEVFQYTNLPPAGADQAAPRQLSPADMELNQSLLHYLAGSTEFPEITYLSDSLSRIKVYREWSFGVSSALRESQPDNQHDDQILNDLSNLYPVLHRASQDHAFKYAILDGLSYYARDITDFEVESHEGLAKLYFTEQGKRIPAGRLSDGALRFLCLLAILCNPDPPPLICIEEPEIGMHMDTFDKISWLFRDASEATQLIVTTHSDILLDYWSDMPESLVICEKPRGSTTLERLTLKKYRRWSEIATADRANPSDDYGLGPLWQEGFLGGVW